MKVLVLNAGKRAKWSAVKGGVFFVPCYSCVHLCLCAPLKKNKKKKPYYSNIKLTVLSSTGYFNENPPNNQTFQL